MKAKLVCNMLACEGCGGSLSATDAFVYCSNSQCSFYGKKFAAPSLDLKEITVRK